MTQTVHCTENELMTISCTVSGTDWQQLLAVITAQCSALPHLCRSSVVCSCSTNLGNNPSLISPLFSILPIPKLIHSQQPDAQHKKQCYNYYLSPWMIILQHCKIPPTFKSMLTEKIPNENMLLTMLLNTDTDQYWQGFFCNLFTPEMPRV